MNEGVEIVLSIGTIVCIFGSMIVFFSCLTDYNNFFKWWSKLDEHREKIKLAEAEELKIGKMLREMMEKYFDYETTIFKGAGEGHENLLALADKYPELKTNEVIQTTAKQLKTLTQQVTKQKEYYNQYVQRIREASMAWPSRYFVPKDLDINSIQYLDENKINL